EPAFGECGHGPPVDGKEDDGNLRRLEEFLLTPDVGRQSRKPSVVRQICLSVDRIEPGCHQVVGCGGGTSRGPDALFDGPRDGPGSRVVVRVRDYEYHLRPTVFVRHTGETKL